MGVWRRRRVFSAYVKEMEGKPESTPWGKKMTFGNLMAEFSNGGGIHTVSLSDRQTDRQTDR